MQAFGRQESTHQLGMWSYHRSLANRMIPSLTNLCHLFPFVHLVGFKHHHRRTVLSALVLGTPQCSSPFSTLQVELPRHNTEVSSLQFGPTFSSAEVRRYRVRKDTTSMTADMHNGYPHYQHSIAIVLLKTMRVPARVDLHQNSYQL